MDRKTYNEKYEYDLRAIAKRVERKARKRAEAAEAREPSGLDPMGEAINRAERLKGLTPHQRRQLPKYRRGRKRMTAGGGYA